LIASFGISEKTFHAKAQELIAIGVAVLFADDDEARFRVALHKIR
jgi:hypothetical protein